MGTLLNKLLKAYRKEHDEKYAQVKERQGRDVDGSRKRKPEEASGASAAAAAPPAQAGKSAGSGTGVKKMKLVLSRPAGGQVGAALQQPSADASSAVASVREDNEYDL